MHINLILGFLVIIAVIWLVKSYRAQKAEKAEPAQMLMDEMGKRRQAHDEGKRAGERLLELRIKRLRPVVQGVNDMKNALRPGESKGSLTVQDEGQTAVLHLEYKPRPESDPARESLFLEWNVKNFDIELFSGQSSLQSVPGVYIIRMQDGAIIAEPDFNSYMRRLSGLIADRLA